LELEMYFLHYVIYFVISRFNRNIFFKPFKTYLAYILKSILAINLYFVSVWALQENPLKTIINIYSLR